MVMKRIAALFLVLLAVSQPLSVSAQPRGPRGGGYEQPNGGGRGGGQTISMEQAVAIVSRRVPGRLLDASPAGNYRIVWLTNDGRRIDFIVDAGTGAILSGG